MTTEDAAAAKARAEALFKRQVFVEAVNGRQAQEPAREAEAEKMAKLRALRLDKEASDRIAAEVRRAGAPRAAATMISGRQIREARRLLNWTIPRLSARTKAPEHIFARAEQIDDTSALTLDQVAAIKTASKRPASALSPRTAAEPGCG